MRLRKEKKEFYIPRFAFLPTKVFNRDTEEYELLWLSFYKHSFMFDPGKKIRYMISENPNYIWRKYIKTK